MLKFGTLLTLSGITSLVTFVGRFWIYDRDLRCDWKDDVKLILHILDVFKDTFIYFLLLSYFLN